MPDCKCWHEARAAADPWLWQVPFLAGVPEFVRASFAAKVKFCICLPLTCSSGNLGCLDPFVFFTMRSQEHKSCTLKKIKNGSQWGHTACLHLRVCRDKVARSYPVGAKSHEWCSIHEPEFYLVWFLRDCILPRFITRLSHCALIIKALQLEWLLVVLSRSRPRGAAAVQDSDALLRARHSGRRQSNGGPQALPPGWKVRVNTIPAAEKKNCQRLHLLGARLHISLHDEELGV